jgi:hypothetical protein
MHPLITGGPGVPRWMAFRNPLASYPVGQEPMVHPQPHPDYNSDGLIFASSIGTPLDRHNVLREFRKITEVAGLGDRLGTAGAPPHICSLLSSDGMPLEDIADLAGHKGTVTTEAVYRRVIVPELRRVAEVMDRLFS